MPHSDPSQQPITAEEFRYALEWSSENPYGSFETLQTFVAAKKALLVAVSEAMSGDVDSPEIAGDVIEELIAQTAVNLALAICTEEETEERITYTAELLHSLQMELMLFVQSFATDAEFFPGNYDDTEEAARDLLEKSDPDDHSAIIIRVTEDLYKEVLTDLLVHAPEDVTEDPEPTQKEWLLDRAKVVATQGAKFAFGAIVLAAVNHALKRR